METISPAHPHMNEDEAQHSKFHSIVGSIAETSSFVIQRKPRDGTVSPSLTPMHANLSHRVEQSRHPLSES